MYDISHWVRRHPGGSIPLLQYAGRDMTDAFRAYHGPDGKASKTLASYYVGELVEVGGLLRVGTRLTREFEAREVSNS